jgi:L-ascorbate metabolism protein UlaG (beta-lactamase superfamily)
MEITWFGDTCIRLKGREGVVVADGYRSVVGPTGRGLTGDICTYSHADTSEPPRGKSKAAAAAARNGTGILRPASLEPAFYLDAPGEYEVHDVLITGVRTFRDEAKGAEKGLNTAFVMELDGLHAVHLGDVGHLLTEEALAELGSVDVVCVSIGSSLSATKAAEIVAQLDANLVVPMPVGEDQAHASAELDRFLHEMGVQQAQPVSKLSVSISTVPNETTVVVLEARGRV